MPHNINPVDIVPGKMPVPDVYWYKVTVSKKWHSVTSVTVDFDHGRGLIQRGVKLRLARIEGYTPSHPQSQPGIEMVNTLLPFGNSFYVRTVPNPRGEEITESWQRWLAEVFIQADSLSPLMNLNDILVKQGFAQFQEGHGPYSATQAEIETETDPDVA